MLYRLVAVGVLPHPGDDHFGNFVDREAVVRIVKRRGRGEDGIQLRYEARVAAHELDQTLGVVEYRPGVVPGGAFGEGVAPFIGPEGRLETAVPVAPAHEVGRRVEHVAVIARPLTEARYFLLWLPQGFGQFADTEIVVAVFQGTGCVLVDAHVVGDVAQFVVVFHPVAAHRAQGAFVFGIFQDGLVEGFDIEAADAFQVGVGDDRGRVGADHTIAVPWAGPLR